MTLKEIFDIYGSSVIYDKGFKYKGKYIYRLERVKEKILAKLMPYSYECFNSLSEKMAKKDVIDGVQTLQYMILNCQTSNGQTPFVSVALYLNEAKTPELKADLALVIEEILRQRIKGVKNEKGQWYANPFPKLLYHLEEDNIKGGKYFYLTQLAVKCTAMRMVPDYISEKIMLENKIDKNGEGHCYPPMGCRSFLTPYVDEDNVPKYYGRFNQGRLAA